MGKKLYIGNLNYRTTEDGLRAAFEAFGEVDSVTVVTDRETGRSRGFGFVEMATDQAADAAVAGLNGASLDDRAITVAEAKPKTDRPGGGGGGRFGGGGGGGYGGGGGSRGGGRGRY